MSDKDFWTKFFQSYYFRKDQINMPNDLFADCAFKDDEELRSKLRRTLTDPIDIIDSQKNFASEDVRPLNIYYYHDILDFIYIMKNRDSDWPIFKATRR